MLIGSTMNVVNIIYVKTRAVNLLYCLAWASLRSVGVCTKVMRAIFGSSLSCFAKNPVMMKINIDSYRVNDKKRRLD